MLRECRGDSDRDGPARPSVMRWLRACAVGDPPRPRPRARGVYDRGRARCTGGPPQRAAAQAPRRASGARSTTSWTPSRPRTTTTAARGTRTRPSRSRTSSGEAGSPTRADGTCRRGSRAATPAPDGPIVLRRTVGARQRLLLPCRQLPGVGRGPHARRVHADRRRVGLPRDRPRVGGTRSRRSCRRGTCRRRSSCRPTAWPVPHCRAAPTQGLVRIEPGTTRRSRTTLEAVADDYPWTDQGSHGDARSAPGRSGRACLVVWTVVELDAPGKHRGDRIVAARRDLPARALTVSVSASPCCPAGPRCARGAWRSNQRGRSRSPRTRRWPGPPRPTARRRG